MDATSGDRDQEDCARMMTKELQCGTDENGQYQCKGIEKVFRQCRGKAQARASLVFRACIHQRVPQELVSSREIEADGANVFR